MGRCFRGTQQGGAGFHERGLCENVQYADIVKMLDVDDDEEKKHALREEANINDVDISLETLQVIVDMGFSKQAAQTCLLYTSPSPRDLSTSRMPSSA